MKTTRILLAIIFLSTSICSAQKYDLKTAKTYAELSVKTDGQWANHKYIGGTTFKNVTKVKLAKEHTDHSFAIRYEGPGWESNKIAYRLYLDWRNAIDIFGKKTEKIILPIVGQTEEDSYHKMNAWGCDILNSGKGIGIGSINRFLDREKLHFREVDSTFATVDNSTTKSTVKIHYYGWKTASDKIDFTSELTIVPDELYTKHTIQASKEIEGICTGIVKQKNSELLKKVSKNKKWAYLATYGEQSVVPDKLGMAIFYQTNTIENLSDTELDHLIVFKPSTRSNYFYLLATWEQQQDGIKSKDAFVTYLDQKLKQLNKNNKL